MWFLFPPPLLPMLYHRPEWQVLWEHSVDHLTHFPHLKTKTKRVAPKLLLGNAFCITCHSSCMETSFSISELSCFSFVFILLFFPNYILWLNCSLYCSCCEQLEGNKNKYRPQHCISFLAIYSPWYNYKLHGTLAWAASTFLQPGSALLRLSEMIKWKDNFYNGHSLPVQREVPCLGKQPGGITTISLSKWDRGQSQYCFSNEGGNFWLL